MKNQKLMMKYLSENISERNKDVLLEILNSCTRFKVLINKITKNIAIPQITSFESDIASGSKSVYSKNSLLSNILPHLNKYFLKISVIILLVFATYISAYTFSKGHYNSSSNMTDFEVSMSHSLQTKTTTSREISLYKTPFLSNIKTCHKNNRLGINFQAYLIDGYLLELLVQSSKHMQHTIR